MKDFVCDGSIYSLFLYQHLFACDQKESLIKSMMESAAAFVGIAVKQRKEPISFDQFVTHKMGKYR
jgi:DnaJ family protein C protein 13